MKNLNLTLSAVLLSLTLTFQTIHASDLQDSHIKGRSEKRQGNNNIIGSFFTRTQQTIPPNSPITFNLSNIKEGIKVLNGGTAFKVKQGGLFWIEFEVQGFSLTGSVPVDLKINGKLLDQPITIPLLGLGANPSLETTSFFLHLSKGTVISVVNADSTDTLNLTDGTLEAEEVGVIARFNIQKVK